MKDPSFTSHFQDKRKAVQALNILIAAREFGMTNRQVLDIPFFLALFNQEYIAGKSKDQLEWKLKNIMRDLGKVSYDDLSAEWHDFKKHFENVRRKNKI